MDEPSKVCRPEGTVTLEKIVDGFGKVISFEQAEKYGWLKRLPLDQSPHNLFLDSGRQILAFCLGFRSPIDNYTLQRFGVGTGITTPNVTDVALEAPVTLASQGGATTAPVSSIDFLTAFVLRVNFNIALGDANGNLLTEFGLYSGNSTLMARKVQGVGLAKTADFSPSISWRLRM